MAKYNLFEDGFDSYYSLQKDEFYFYKIIMDYLEEDDITKVISISDINGMQNQDDFDEFCRKYCPEDDKYLNKIFDDSDYEVFTGINDFGDKYIWASTEGCWNFLFITEDFLNKYINTKKEIKENN